MATTTLTYNQNDPQPGELTAEEQDSLQIGEELQAQQEQLLAGKYENASQLEEAYISLQKKLGQTDEEFTEDEVEQPEGDYESDAEEGESLDDSFLNTLWEESQSEYSDETLETLSEMDPTDIAQMYLQQREAMQPVEMTDEQVTTLKDSIGGDEQYENMLGWAADNISEQDQELFDTAIDRGDPLTTFFAIQALNSRFLDSTGTEGEMVTGRAPTSSGDIFESQEALVEAMSDPRYDKDPAYRKSLMNKLDRSNLNF